MEQNPAGRDGTSARMWRRTKRGRPRTLREQTDLGTPELRALRTALAAGQPVLSQYPLGVLLARGLIDAAQHDAGCSYAHLYGRIIGRTQPSQHWLYEERIATAGLREIGPESGNETAQQALFRAGKNRLLAAGRRVCDATENLVVFGRFPRFLDPDGRRGGGARQADAAELAAVIRGLDALVVAYGRAAGGTGRADSRRAPRLRRSRRAQE